jgi:hypothetical protein
MLKKSVRRLIVWDLLMVLIASANLLLILFDLSYFRLRPFYLQYFSEIQLNFDKVKGIEPHRTTDEFLKTMIKIEKNLSSQPEEKSQKQLDSFTAQKLTALKQLRKIISDNPFESAGLTGNLQKIKKEITEYAERNLGYAGSSSKKAFEQILNEDNSELAEFFHTVYLPKIKPLIEENYYRHLGLDGEPYDDFFYLDLPFLIFFLLEFLGRWLYSVRKKEYEYKFLFLIYHWYDILGLLPYQATRIFRLFRIYTIIQKLKEMNLVKIGEDPISVFIKNFINIILNDVTDRVSAQIIDRAQDQIKGRDSSQAILNALEPQKENIVNQSRKVIVNSMQASYNSKLRSLLAESLEDSARRVPSLILVPDLLKETLTREIGLAVYDSINDALLKNISEPGPDNVIEQITEYLTSKLFDEEQQNDIRDLMETITLDILENIKNQPNLSSQDDA